MSCVCMCVCVCVYVCTHVPLSSTESLPYEHSQAQVLK